MILETRFGLARMSCSSLISASTSRYSSSIFLRSSAASRARRMSRIACACSSLSLNLAINCSRATSTSAAARIVLITASRLSSAIFRPSKMCARSCAFFSSNSVRRRTMMRRCSMWCCSTDLSESVCGCPSTSASMFMLNAARSGVSFSSLLSTLCGLPSRFTST